MLLDNLDSSLVLRVGGGGQKMQGLGIFSTFPQEMNKLEPIRCDKMDQTSLTDQTRFQFLQVPGAICTQHYVMGIQKLSSEKNRELRCTTP